MQNIRTDTSIHIHAGELVSWIPDNMLYLHVQTGLVWLTIAGDGQDYWLAAGAQMQLPAGRQIVMEAEGRKASFSLTRLCGTRAISLPPFGAEPACA